MRNTAGSMGWPTHSFTLLLDGVSDLTDELANSLYEAGCDDALLAMSEGVVSLGFDRRAPSLRDAILSAIAQVQLACPELRVLRVERDEFLSATEIGRRLGRTATSIRLLASGKKGEGGFPRPVDQGPRGTPLWAWADVVRWLSTHALERPALQRLQADEQEMFVAALNAMLELRRVVPDLETVTDLWQATGIRPQSIS